MYELLQAEEKHIEQLVPLLASTGYWDFGFKNNTLNIDHREFMKEGVVKPHLPFTTVLVKKEDYDQVIGAIVCATKQALSNIPESKYDTSLDPRIIYLFDNVLKLELTESYHISFLAVIKAYRGRGLGRKLLEYAEKKAQLAGCETLSLYTVSCQTSAIQLYLQFGMMITQVITVSKNLQFPNFLYFEKNKSLMAQRDYFETEEYKHLDIAMIFDEKTLENK